VARDVEKAEIVTGNPAALDEVLSLIDQYVERLMQEQGMPGLALAITDRDGLLGTRNYGFADLGALTAVDDDTLFEIGSIGKSFTAICLLQLADEGIVDLDAPVTDYLPWFAVRSQYALISIHHLLTHTAGIIGGSDFSLDPRFEVWSLRDSDAAPPGERCRYSNVGYKALGLLLEAVTDKPYAEIVRERVLDPLEMTHSAGTITYDQRRRLAVGYVPFYDDRPWRPAHGVAPATWLETNTGDGCLSATAADLAIFLRMLLNEGGGPNGRILSPESFARLRAPHTEISPDVPYGYGIVAVAGEGRQLIGHEGGMVGYVSAMLGDVDAGIGVVVLINGMVDPEVIADFALRAFVAAQAGASLPELPPIEPEIEATAFAEIYRGEREDLTVESEEGRLMLIAGSDRIPLDPMRSPAIPDAFVASHPDFDLFPLRFGRDATGSVTELTHGGDWYATDRYEGARTFETPPEWAAYAGHYRSWNPWVSNFRIVVRKGDLLLVRPSGHEQTLHPDGVAFRVGDDPDSPERISFDTIVEGEALRARLAGGADYYRFFTP
jgi:CubicO group peptidase (beta-lactamase class C family)